MFANYIFEKGLDFKIYKKLLQPSKKKNNLIENRKRDRGPE